jgi:pimeloyl-ACP methyl ester carboxylesterase
MDIDHAVEYVLEKTVEAITKKTTEASEPCEGPKRTQVFLIGHAFGGAVATQAACELNSVFKDLGTGSFSVSIKGLCVIDTVPHEDKRELELELLQHARVLLIASQHDVAVDFARPTNLATRRLFGAVPATRKEMLLLPGDGSTGDGHLLLRLTDFVLRGHLGATGKPEDTWLLLGPLGATV